MPPQVSGEGTGPDRGPGKKPGLPVIVRSRAPGSLPGRREPIKAGIEMVGAVRSDETPRRFEGDAGLSVKDEAPVKIPEPDISTAVAFHGEA